MSPDELPAGLMTFVSYGLYNVVIFAQSKSDRRVLRSFLENTGDTAWELWTLKGSKVDTVNYAPVLRLRPPAVIPRKHVLTADLRAAGEEYQTLLAVTNARSGPYLQDVIREMETVDTALFEKIQKLKLHNIRKLQWFININAALSRFSSQTYAGTSPILGTECHFWTHSLLGIGIASMALLNLRRFIDKAAVRANFPIRIDQFKKQKPADAALKSFGSTNEWWTKTQLPALPPDFAGSDVPLLPLIVCFSGRDGFKSTPFTLSAPLETLQSANTYAWSLQTLTHEISHVFVEGAISALLESKYKGKEWAHAILDIQAKRIKASNLHEQLQEFFIDCLGRVSGYQYAPISGGRKRSQAEGTHKMGCYQ